MNEEQIPFGNPDLFKVDLINGFSEKNVIYIAGMSVQDVVKHIEHSVKYKDIMTILGVSIVTNETMLDITEEAYPKFDVSESFMLTVNIKHDLIDEFQYTKFQEVYSSVKLNGFFDDLFNRIKDSVRKGVVKKLKEPEIGEQIFFKRTINDEFKPLLVFLIRTDMDNIKFYSYEMNDRFKLQGDSLDSTTMNYSDYKEKIFEEIQVNGNMISEDHPIKDVKYNNNIPVGWTPLYGSYVLNEFKNED